MQGLFKIEQSHYLHLGILDMMKEYMIVHLSSETVELKPSKQVLEALLSSNQNSWRVIQENSIPSAKQ